MSESETTAIAAPEGDGQPPAQETAPGFLNRLVGIVMSPGETFASVARKPDWLAPLVLVTIVIAASGWVAFSKVDEADMRQFFRHMLGETFDQKGLEIAPEKLEQVVDVQVRWTGVTGRYGPIVFVPVWMLLGALFYFAIFRAFGADATYRQTLSFYVWGMIPMVVKSLVSLPIVLLRDSVSFTEMSSLVRANLSFLVEPAGGQKLLFALLVALDLFAVWTLALRIIGGAKLPGVSKQLSAWTASIGFAISIALTAWNISKTL